MMSVCAREVVRFVCPSAEKAKMPDILHFTFYHFEKIALFARYVTRLKELPTGEINRYD
jgi:hypothetical protein